MRFVSLLAVVSLTACASLDASQCRNPYEVGFRDAIFGMQRQDDVYQTLCTRNGAQLDSARYVQGWQEGKYEFDRRKVHGGSD
jgi:hypothetical protein